MSMSKDTNTELDIKQLHHSFVAEINSINLREVHDKTSLQQIRDAIIRYGVLVFRDQDFSHEEQLDFGKKLDGELYSHTTLSILTQNRFENEALTDISNVDKNGNIFKRDDRRRLDNICNQLWHTDASFEQPNARFSMLYARNVPSKLSITQFADMRKAYEDLDIDTKNRIDNLNIYHSIVYSRHTMGFEFSNEEKAQFPGAIHPLVRQIEGSTRKSLYLASHAEHIIELLVPEGRLLIKDLIEHASQAKYIYSHNWTNGQMVIWDNRTTMHRGRPFDDTKYKRELTRVTTLDIPTK